MVRSCSPLFGIRHHGHDGLSGDPIVARIWRRQTFSAAVESCAPDLTASIVYEHIPELMGVLNGTLPVSGGVSVLDSAYTFSRMLHSSGSSSGDVFYRAFVPELGSILYPRQIELVKRCLKSERGEHDRVGATIFPGLVKVSEGLKQPNGQLGDKLQVSYNQWESLFFLFVMALLGVDCCEKGSSDLRMRTGGKCRSIISNNVFWDGNAWYVISAHDNVNRMCIVSIPVCVLHVSFPLQSGSLNYPTRRLEDLRTVLRLIVYHFHISTVVLLFFLTVAFGVGQLNAFNVLCLSLLQLDPQENQTCLYGLVASVSYCILGLRSKQEGLFGLAKVGTLNRFIYH
jgi:hypothetical protein